MKTDPIRTAKAGVGGAAGRRMSPRRIAIMSALRTGFGAEAMTTPIGNGNRLEPQAGSDHSNPIRLVNPTNPLLSRSDPPYEAKPGDAGESVQDWRVSLEHQRRPQDHQMLAASALCCGFPGFGDASHLRECRCPGGEHGLLGDELISRIGPDRCGGSLHPPSQRLRQGCAGRDEGVRCIDSRITQVRDICCSGAHVD